jgi:GNAT superfamily N-acetyltransferase
MVHVRRAAEDDASFLQEMVATAADWRPDAPVRSVTDVMRVPSLAHYVVDWPRPGDMGVVAEEGGPIGAAWWRFFDADDPGYGFVDPAIPELSLAVRHAWRGQGVGTTLLREILLWAVREGVGSVSLSVESDNPAIRLYERAGFDAVGTSGGSVTMLLRRPAERAVVL